MASNSQYSFLLPSGVPVIFDNPDDFYPVNPYQSEVLAQICVQQILDMAAETGTGLKSLKAAEWCCGNGPVAVTLKKLGVGHVGAFDINPGSLNNAKHNASLNGVSLNDANICDLNNIQSSFGKYDLIGVNPPCRPNSGVPDDVSSAVKTALSGGAGGIDFFIKAVYAASKHLTAKGRFVVVLISVMDIIGCVRAMNEVFGDNWYAAPTTPILHARPRLSTEDPFQQEAFEEALQKDPSTIAYRDGGHVKVVTWILVAHCEKIKNPLPFSKRFPLRAYGQPFQPANLELDHAFLRLKSAFAKQDLDK